MLADMPTRSAAHVISFQGQWNWSIVLAHCERVARAHAISADEAQEVAQEAAFRAWRHRASCRDADPRAWLSAIVHREVIRVATSRRCDAPLALIDEAAEPASEVVSVPLRLDVHRALDSLAQEDRTIMLLRYETDLKQKDIAAQLGMPEGTVKVRLHRARAQLRSILTESRQS